METKKITTFFAALLLIALPSKYSLALPSKDEALAACSSLVKKARLDPVIDSLYGEQLARVAMRDCIITIGESNGDPKKAIEVSKRLKSEFGKSMWALIGSPYVSQTEKSMAVNIDDWHTGIMNNSARIAGDYSELEFEAKKPR
ncbi:hypothetical protein [Phytobacter ursingii]|uniref:Uncharacterized protein n=1 Tax=Phytobacter ursingii TaxID=1972431 RepID=A0AB35RIK0_9ENTR|nr:hypothetical protein [Phytobacter ursingii]MDV2861856.1 hypothetical protein [Phytobacter ursingii]